MSTFEPIAIIGEGCVLPGALSPEQLWQQVVAGRDLTSNATAANWAMKPEFALCAEGEATADRAWCARGGFVNQTLPSLHLNSMGISAELLAEAAPGVRWSIYAAVQALISAGYQPEAHLNPEVGVILGNLSYAPQATNLLFSEHWLQRAEGYNGTKPLPVPFAKGAYHHRFAGTAPARWVAQAVGASGPAFCLDAACASSLYAIKLACDYLHAGKAQMVLAGAVNHADTLYLNVGFTALKALSRAGQSRPFDQGADGLVPGEGAAVVLLKPLRDAIRDGDTVRGVIRGVGLSNDGRDGGFLSPSQAGQMRALVNAYRQAGVSPKDVSYIECHATGTAAGDKVELATVNAFFSEREQIALASLKSNLGHLITTAGAAGLIRLLQCMEHGKLAPSINLSKPIAGFAEGPARVVTALEDWGSSGPLMAGVNAFGFGGNNAHLLVQHQWHNKVWPAAPAKADPAPSAEDPIVICGIKLRTARVNDQHALLRQWANGAKVNGARASLETITVDLAKLGFPPSDLHHTNAQQLLVMQLIRDALEEAGSYQPETTAVFTGMAIDMEGCRYTLRTRLVDWVSQWKKQGVPIDDKWLRDARDAVTTPITAAGVLGTMPNMPANRSNHQLNLQGASFTVSAEELSGVVALEVAKQALVKGEIELAVVAAVDLAGEPVHQAAMDACVGRTDSTDGAVVLLLQRRSDALKAGRPIYAEIADLESGDNRLGQADLSAKLGDVHAASGLLAVATGALLLHHGLQGQAGSLVPDVGAVRQITVATHASTISSKSLAKKPNEPAASAPVYLTTSEPAAPVKMPVHLYLFTGESRAALFESIKNRRWVSDFDGNHAKHKFRLAIVANSTPDLENKAEQCLQRLTELRSEKALPVTRLLPDVFYSERPLVTLGADNIACVFTGAAAAYPGMGRELCSLFPEALQRTLAKQPVLHNCLPWLDSAMGEPASPFDVLQGCSLLSQVHAELTQHLLGIKPGAMLGISSGETNSMFAADVWQDMGGLFSEISASNMYEQWIAGQYKAAQVTWQDPTVNSWLMLRVVAPVSEVQTLLAEQKRVEVTMINAHNDCVVAGERGAVESLLPGLKLLASAVVPMGHDIIAHNSALKSWEKPWYDIHHRPTRSPQNIRLYSNAFGGAYDVTAERVAQALTQQAVNNVDFRPVVEAAYRDGVRVFIEQGPRQSCSEWIHAQLGEREHLAVSFDRAGGGVEVFYSAIAQLWCAGVEMDSSALTRLIRMNAVEQSTGTLRSFPAHPPAIVFPPLPDSAAREDVTMPPAPALRDMPVTLDTIRSASDVEDSAENLAALKNLLANAPQPDYDKPQPSESIERVAAAAPSWAVRTSANPAVSVLQRLHTEIVQNHQRYLAFQQQAAQVLWDSHQRSCEITRVSLPVSAQQAEPVAQAVVQTAAPVAAPHAEEALAVRETAREIARAPELERPSTQPHSPDVFPGPKFDRKDLEALAGGRISALFGPLFEQQDHYPRQVRMPQPPLLLADRVLGIDATPGAMESRGSIWTETDVDATDWYVHHGHMPAGIMIEAGQADLLLIS